MYLVMECTTTADPKEQAAVSQATMTILLGEERTNHQRRAVKGFASKVKRKYCQSREEFLELSQA